MARCKCADQESSESGVSGWGVGASYMASLLLHVYGRRERERGNLGGWQAFFLPVGLYIAQIPFHLSVKGGGGEEEIERTGFFEIEKGKFR